MRLATLALTLGLVTLFGCGGGDDSSADSAGLVRYEISGGELNFKFGEPQDSVVPVPDTLLVVGHDGQATYEFADQPKIEFRLDEGDLAKLEAGLREIDFQEADDMLSGETREGLPAFSVTHDGTEVELGDDFIAVNYGEGSAIADRMTDLLTDLDRIISRAPGAEEAADEYLRNIKNG